MQQGITACAEATIDGGMVQSKDKESCTNCRGKLTGFFPGKHLIHFLVLKMKDFQNFILHASQPVSQPASQPASQVSRQPGLAGSQAGSQPASQAGRQQASKPGCQAASQPASQAASQPASQPTKQAASQPASQPASQQHSHFWLWTSLLKALSHQSQE